MKWKQQQQTDSSLINRQIEQSQTELVSSQHTKKKSQAHRFERKWNRISSLWIN